MNIVVQTRQKRNKNRKKKPPSVLAWIKQHVCEIDLGMKVKKKDGTIGPIHLNYNRDILAHFAKLRLKQRSWLEHAWNWTKLRYHFLNEQTYYFCGAGQTRKPKTIFMIDVDCKKIGTPEGARAFLDYLATKECGEKYGLHFP